MLDRLNNDFTENEFGKHHVKASGKQGDVKD
jgi:hypothetical protein